MRIADVVHSEARSLEPLQVRPLHHEGAGFQAVALPGNGTRALSPMRLTEVDLEVPVAHGEAIRLVRSYNSFLRSPGTLGPGMGFGSAPVGDHPNTRRAQGGRGALPIGL